MILLDTHVWVWWLGAPEKLSTPAREAIDDAVDAGKVWVSAISAWEVALLVKKGRLELSMEVEPWLARAESLPFLDLVPVDPRVAVRSVNLPGPLHEDPADRIILATALALGAPLVTRDTKLQAYPGVATIW